MIPTNTDHAAPISTRLRRFASDGGDRVAVLAADGIERSSDVVSRSARDAAEAARRWADDVTSDTSELLDVRGRRHSVRRWVIVGLAAVAAVIGLVWAIRLVRTGAHGAEEEPVRAPEGDAGGGVVPADRTHESEDADEHRVAS